MIKFLNGNEEVHGILVQLPLPQPLQVHPVFDLIAPEKDVDVFNPVNVGLLTQGRPRFLPCTPHAVQQLLANSGIVVAGKKVVVINRSDVVGKPLASMLTQDHEFGNATVTVCHDRTPAKLLFDITKAADIVVVAVGKPGFLTGNMISEGAVVIDVGINTTPEGKVVGDVHVSCRDIAGYLTPVPGGVGPMTVTMLLENTLQAAKDSVARSPGWKLLPTC
jgi:methylenetetrahydrofolate dehydrogenase (NADP+) / methenyltetrahydrofolate cyclohydrolase